MDKKFLRDLVASLVVFLVALPLCLGVAIACHVPAALGIISGVIGGIVVGAAAGSPLQVTGPAAGLILSVVAIVAGWGVAALGWAVLISGALQLLLAAFRMGRWFRAVSPALIGGMLAGIGTVIVVSQLYVMIDAEAPEGGGITQTMELPAAWIERMGSWAGASAAMLGLGTVVLLILWDRFRPKKLEVVPGPLIAVLLTTGVAVVFSLPAARVELPASLAQALNIPSFADTGRLFTDIGFIGVSLSLGLIAAAEALLCANATDRLHDGPPTNYNKELFALGLGNVVAGVLGALPVTGVIVRSSANIRAGATTRRSAIAHGFLLLALVALAPALLEFIPEAVLAGVLVYVGAKLLAPKKAYELYKAGQGEVWVFGATVLAIFAFGLLWGILVGLIVSLLKLLYTFSHLEVEVTQEGQRFDLDVHGAATFVALPKLAEALEKIPEDAEVHVHIGGLAYVDHACAELLRRQQERRQRAGGKLFTEWDEVRRLQVHRPLLERQSTPGEEVSQGDRLEEEGESSEGDVEESSKAEVVSATPTGLTT